MGEGNVRETWRGTPLADATCHDRADGGRSGANTEPHPHDWAGDDRGPSRDLQPLADDNDAEDGPVWVSSSSTPVLRQGPHGSWEEILLSSWPARDPFFQLQQICPDRDNEQTTPHLSWRRATRCWTPQKSKGVPLH